MKTKVTNILIKWGNNSDEVAKMVAENFDYAIRVYPEATARELEIGRASCRERV